MTDREAIGILNNYYAYCNLTSQVEQAQLVALKALQEREERSNGWISTSDKLPEKQKDVLMYFDTGNMAVGFWHDGDEVLTFWCAYTDDGWYTDCDCYPIYWMPLPGRPLKGVDNGS